ncbi:MAG: cobalamin-dependent protein [Gemmatimonadales bacterium]|jgi:methanogenic corrinoid protein MtbC1
MNERPSTGNRTRKHEPRHPIQVVARRTSLTPDVLRAWERRYGAVRPHRSSGRRRLYSDADVDRLILLRLATEAGRPISQLAEKSDDELRQLLTDDVRAEWRIPAPASGSNPVAHAGAVLGEAVAAARRLDAARLRAALASAALSLSPGELIEWVLVPLMRTVGSLWRDGELGIANEHLTSAIVRSLLSELALQHEQETAGPTIVVATPAGQRHELGALVVAATAPASGWKVRYVGADIPSGDIAAAARQTNAPAVALSITYPLDDAGLAEELRSLRAAMPEHTLIIAGGTGAAAYAGALSDIGALVLDGSQALRSALASLRHEARAEVA